MVGLTIALLLGVLVVAFLQRLFLKSGAKAGDALAAAVALGFGLVLSALGTLHTISVAPGPHQDNVEPYDTRQAWLLTVGLIIVHTGLVNTLLCRRIGRGERWALGMAATATLLFFVFVLIVHPAANQIVWVLLSGGYLALLLWRLREGVTGSGG